MGAVIFLQRIIHTDHDSCTRIQCRKVYPYCEKSIYRILEWYWLLITLCWLSPALLCTMFTKFFFRILLVQFNSQRTYCEIESHRIAWVCLKYGNAVVCLAIQSYVLSEKLKDKCCIGTYANLLHHVHN